MQFQKKTSVSKSGYFIKILIKITVLFLSITFIDKIDFPSPNKIIEKIVPNETFKVLK